LLNEDDYHDLQALLSLASSTLQEAKQTLLNGPDHWAKEQIDKMLTQLNDEISVAATLVDESYVVVSSDAMTFPDKLREWYDLDG
jgi:hypothetical protein